ncbi:MAG TPA: SURF1 family cytochrome oxidase biogenesis protein [Candidatus Paceibacterota bacterium]|nr:SURF1 family cytochrome oxidase biogenesis protein [Candidatus Paceibacterota bacterium]
MSRSSTQRALAYLGVCAIALAFISLGMWQWNRAQDSRILVVVDTKLVSLDSITKPRIALPEKATLRRVSVAGTYVRDFKAPNQVDAKGQRRDWGVGLLQTETGAGMLVVRGLWSDRDLHPVNPDESVIVIGKLMPHQSDDHALASRGVLPRLDSSVIVGQTSLDLYDGYVIAETEKIGRIEISRAKIAPPAPRTAVPGFYWQHVSYVVIWWFMALVVLYLPFYQRRVAPSEFESVEIREEKASDNGAN